MQSSDVIGVGSGSTAVVGMLYVASAFIEHHHTRKPSNAHSGESGDGCVLAVATASGVGQGTSSDVVAERH